MTSNPDQPEDPGFASTVMRMRLLQVSSFMRKALIEEQRKRADYFGAFVSIYEDVDEMCTRTRLVYLPCEALEDLGLRRAAALVRERLEARAEPDAGFVFAIALASGPETETGAQKLAAIETFVPDQAVQVPERGSPATAATYAIAQRFGVERFFQTTPN